jgi:hypothetical protein
MPNVVGCALLAVADLLVNFLLNLLLLLSLLSLCRILLSCLLLRRWFRPLIFVYIYILTQIIGGAFALLLVCV